MKRRRNRSQRGFTLVELMVSLTLFSFAIAGVLAVAVSMAQGYREQRQIVQTESTARGALDYIADAVRMASPAVSKGEVASTSVANNVVVGDIEDLTRPDVAGACPSGAVRVVNSNSGPDELDIVFASGGVVTSVAGAWSSTPDTTLPLTDTSNIAVGDYLLVTDGTHAHIVKVTNVGSPTSVTVAGATCTPTPGLAHSYVQGDLVVRVLHARFYVGSFDGVSPVLLMDTSGTGAAAEPLADQVEDFQIAMGVDEDDDAEFEPATEWGFASAVAPTSFTTARDLRALRITLIARAPLELNAAPTFYRPQLEDHAQATAPDGYRRRILTATVDVRNLGGSP